MYAGNHSFVYHNRANTMRIFSLVEESSENGFPACICVYLNACVSIPSENVH